MSKSKAKKKKKSANWGGARSGAGRKFIDGEKRSKRVQFKITETEHNKAGEVAEAKKLTGYNLVNALSRMALKDILKEGKE